MNYTTLIDICQAHLPVEPRRFDIELRSDTDACSTMRVLSDARYTDARLHLLRIKIGTCIGTTSARERSHC